MAPVIIARDGTRGRVICPINSTTIGLNERKPRVMDEKNNTNSNNEKLSIAALVCGLTSIFIFPLAFGAAGIIFGLMVQDRVEKDTREYQNARLGIVFGILGLVFWIVSLVTLNYLGFDANSFFGGSAQPQSAI